MKMPCEQVALTLLIKLKNRLKSKISSVTESWIRLRALTRLALLNCLNLLKGIKRLKEFLTKRRSWSKSKLSKSKDTPCRTKPFKWSRTMMERILMTLSTIVRSPRKSRIWRRHSGSSWMTWERFRAGNLPGRGSKTFRIWSMVSSFFPTIQKTITF